MKKYCSDICSDVPRVLLIPEVATKGGQVGCPVWLKLSSLLLPFVGRGSPGIRFAVRCSNLPSHSSLTPISNTSRGDSKCAADHTVAKIEASVSTDMGQKEALAGQK